jgi:hypothetical protein
MMKPRWSVWLNSWWLSIRLWNVDRVLVDCWNNEENVNVLKWLVWGGYIIVLRWILNRLWDVDWAIMNLGCWWMLIWVLWMIYCCILLNGCISITKDLLLYFIECNCYEWLYEYYKGSTVIFYQMKLSRMVVWVLQKIYHCIILNVNYHRWLYEYYEGSIVVLYWTLIVMNGWMSNTKGVLLCYWMLNCLFVCVLRRIYYNVLLNVKLLRNTCTSITKGLLLCCSEYQVVMNRLNTSRDITMLQWFHKPSLKRLIGWWLVSTNGIRMDDRDKWLINFG